MELNDRDFVTSTQEEKANYACFYNNAVKNERASAEAGHDVFIDKIYILIVSPGQNKTEVRRPMQEVDKAKYPTAFRAFQEKQEAPVIGTPINYLPGLSLARLEELKALNVRTVEMLANLGQQQLQHVGMGANELQQKAQAFMQKNTPEILELRQQVANLQAQVLALSTAQAAAQAQRDQDFGTAMLESKKSDIEGKLAKRRGRPPKVLTG